MNLRTRYLQYQKLIVYTIFVLMATQLIYLNTEYGYVHVVLYMLFLMSMDVYKPEYRDVKSEIIIHGLVLGSTLTLMLADYLGEITGFIYYPIIIVVSYFNIKFAHRLKDVFVKRELDKINERNIKMFEREGKFLVIYTYIVTIILIGIIGYSIYLMFT